MGEVVRFDDSYIQDSLRSLYIYIAIIQNIRGINLYAFVVFRSFMFSIFVDSVF